MLIGADRAAHRGTVSNSATSMSNCAKKSSLSSNQKKKILIQNNFIKLAKTKNRLLD